jgi:hypothetical protein
MKHFAAQFVQMLRRKLAVPYLAGSLGETKLSRRMHDYLTTEHVHNTCGSRKFAITVGRLIGLVPDTAQLVTRYIFSWVDRSYTSCVPLRVIIGW